MSHVVMKSGELARYTPNERVNHWITVILFVLLRASGLAFFHPASGSCRACLRRHLGAHPASVPGCADVRLVRCRGVALLGATNRIEAHDREWMKHVGDFINNRDTNLPEIGKYNAGQKYVFWTM